MKHVGHTRIIHHNGSNKLYLKNVEDDDVTKLYYKDKKAIDNLEDTSENIINDKKFVCLFVYVAALPTHSSQGTSEVKDTCLHLVKEFRKGGRTAQHTCVRVD